MSIENKITDVRDKISMRELVLLLLSTLTVMAGATISPALPKMQSNFSSIPNVEFLVRLILTIPALFIALGAPVMGIIVDKWGRKNLLFITTILYGLAGSLGFILDSVEAILISRALLGVAVAGIMTSSTTLIADYYQNEQRNRVLGYQAGFIAFGGIFFLILGGFFAEIGWQYPFLIYLLAIPLVPGIWVYLHEPIRTTNSGSKETEGKTVNFNPNIPYLAIGVAYISTLILQIFFLFTITELPFFLTDVLLLESGLVGIVLASTTITAGILSLAYKQIKRQFDFIVIFIISYLFFALGFFLIFLLPSLYGIILSLLIAGIGLGLFVPNITVWITSVTSESSRGRALSGFASFLFLGQFLSPFISQQFLKFIKLTELFAISGLFLGFMTIIFIIAMRFQNSKPR